MKLGDIIVRVQRQFGDDIEAQITEEDIVRWINDACLDIATANSTNQGHFLGTTPVTEGIRKYELPDDLLLLRSIRLDNAKLTGTTYEQIAEIDPAFDSAVGKPTHYWVYNKNINLYPTPNQSYNNLVIMYIKTPDIMSVALKYLEPDVPVQYHLRIVEYCIAQAAELDDNIAQYNQKMQQFKGSLVDLKSNGEQPESDGVYPSITYMSEYD